MYFFIKGVLSLKSDGFVVVENGGIGYKLIVSDNTMSAFNTGDTVTVYTYLYVREDIMDLYGFATLEEKSIFLNLLTVSGVGAKAAISVLSIGTPSKIAAAIITNDAKTIQKAQGVGAKSAQRIILELKDKLNAANLNIPDDITAPPADMGRLSEAINALTVLGYSDKESAEAVRGIDLSLNTEEIVKLALRNMFKGV